MLYFCGILGASDAQLDDRMVTDIAVAAALVESSSTTTQIYSILPFRSFASNRFKFGDPKADRLEVPVPDDSLVVVNRNGASLKNVFLQKITTLTTRMCPQDQLIIFIAAHGEDDEGEVLIGEQRLQIKDVAAAVRNNAKTILWSTACFSGKWLEGDVPWRGYVAAPSNQESDFASLAADQNIILALPYCSLSVSAKPQHYFKEPTPIQDSSRRSLHDCADHANECRKDLSWTYGANTIADPFTQWPLPVPQLTSKVLNRFKLLRYIHSTPTTTLKTTKAASFRRQIEQLPPIPGLNLQELKESGGTLLDTTISSAHLVYLSGCLQRPNLTQVDVCVLSSAFNHRRQCQLAIETYLDWVGWRSKRPPQWDFSGGGGALEQEMVAGDTEAAAWQAFFCWKPEVAGWRKLTWTDIRQQLALAWEGAGKPAFSAAQFLAVAGIMDNLKKVDILISSPSLQGVVHLISSFHHNASSPPLSS